MKYLKCLITFRRPKSKTMNYLKYFFEFIAVTLLMSAGLYYLIEQSLQDALIIGCSTALLTVINKFFLDRKALRNKQKGRE
mgnify:CR=1 FL=1